ncbi:MAG: Fe-S-containing protein [bacterium]
MNAFVSEAFLLGVKEGLKLSLCTVLVLAFLRERSLSFARGSLFAGIGLISLASLLVVTVQVTPGMRDVITKLVGYVFGLFYFFSLGALYHTTGTDLLGPLKGMFRSRTFIVSVVFVLTALYSLPDMAAASLFVADLFSLADGAKGVLFSAAAGFFASCAVVILIVPRVKVNFIRLFDLPQLLLFLALVKLVAGGVKGAAEFSLIPTVQGGLMKLVHDVVHQAFVILIVPDHPILSTTTWNFIGILFGRTAGLWLSLVLLVVPLFIFLRKHFTAAISVPGEVKGKAVRRKFVKAIKDDRVLKSLPILVFMIFIVSIWFIERGEGGAKLYKPEPVPVSAEQGKVVIPINSPVGDLRDGMMHKYSLTLGADTVRILIMQKKDGRLAVCLDACEICAPDGYAQAPEHVICIYCNTPIPIETLGKPGGCNPIPLPALITDKEVEITLTDIAEKWKKVKSGATKEAIEQ